ncbi:MAG: putative Ig domain-containing protein, partial [Anaerolineales bacterium]|nr:putative Ig domain-containing protein [Anaerolineales bacterium]
IQAPTDLNGNFYAGLRKIQTYYAGKIRYWIIGNEVEGGGYSVFSPEQYAAVIKNMALTLRAVDPAVRIIAGEFYSGTGNQHLALLVSPAYRDYWDILSGHNMVRLRNGNAPVSEYLANLGGLSRPIWDTEANGTIFGGPSEWAGYMYSNFPTSPDEDMHSSIAKHMTRVFCLQARSGNSWLPAYYNPNQPCLGADGFIAMHYNANWETLWALRRHWISDTEQPSELNHKVANFRAAADVLYAAEGLTRIPNTDLADPYNAPVESTYSGADGYIYRYGPEYVLILWRNTGLEGQDRELVLTTDPADVIHWCDSFGNCYPLRNQAGTVKVWVRPDVVYLRGFSRLPTFARETTGNDAPYFITTPVTQAAAGQRYSYTALAYDSDAPASVADSLPKLTYSLVSGPAGLTIANGVLSWTPSTPGAYNVTLRATSQHGAAKSVDQTFTLNVAAGGVAPQFLSLASPLAAPLGQVWRYNANAWDPDGGSLTYALTQAPAGMTIDPASGFLQWTPASLGTFPVTVTASDGAATTSQTFSVKVGAGPIPVTGPAYSVQPAAARQGQTLTFTLQVPGSGQTLTITSVLPTQLNYASATTTCPGGAPTYTAGTRTLAYTGTPASGQLCALTFTAAVGTAARVTVVSAITVDDGSPETLQVSVMLNPLTAFLPQINR